MRKKIVIIGNTPPPVGGVSIHIKRLLKLLGNDRSEYDIEHIKTHDFVSRWGRFTTPAFFFMLIKANADLYHLHKPDHLVSLWYVFFILSILGKKTVFTLHNENIADQFESNNMGLFRELSFRLIFKSFTHIICVNQRTAEVLQKTGISSNRLSVIPAFIPQDNVDIEVLPESIKKFMENRTPKLVGYSHRVYLYKGSDRYGGDMMLEVIKRLVVDFPNIGLVLVMPNKNTKTQEGIQKYCEFIQLNELENNVLIYEDSIDLPALFSISDIHIRPSNTDGDPIAIRESLHINIPTVASDCTFKPEGTILHKDRDHDDFEQQLRHVINNLKTEKLKLHDIQKPDFGMSVINLYDKLLSTH